MSTVPVVFNRAKPEGRHTAEYQTSHAVSTFHPQMKEMRMNMTFQMSNISNDQIFTPSRSGVGTVRRVYHNPELSSTQSQF